MSQGTRSRKQITITLSDEAREKLAWLVERTDWPASRLIESWILGAQPVRATARNRQGG